ncbi:MAG: hemerythrin domain-containing protein, partial [Planctomycetota bacterium]
MKRHSALQDLSRDHYAALKHCQQVRWAAEGHPRARALEEVTRELLEFYSAEGALHFAEEEEVLLPILSRHILPSEDEDVRRMLDDHALIRDRMDRLQCLVEAGG